MWCTFLSEAHLSSFAENGRQPLVCIGIWVGTKVSQTTCFDYHPQKQPRSQGLSSYRPGRARRDPGLVWSRATVTIENIREGSSVIRQFVALSFVALSRHRHHTRYLKEVFGLKFRKVSIRTFIQRLGKSFLRQPRLWCCCRRTRWIYGHL